MSLQVWLPLTKDLRQQGLSNVIVTNNGATFNSTGKLGGAYEFASGKRIQTTLPSTSNLNSKAISFACWVNISSWNSSYDCLMSIADGTGWQQSRATLCRNNTASTLCWNIADGSTSTRVYTTTSLSTNTWYHIACTYDGVNLKIYINGTLNNSAAATLSIGYAGTFNIGGWSGNNYPINCKMNDVRVYSHCLSPMEVKELAKGLVLHYPLNRQGLGPSNLIKNGFGELGTKNWTNSSNISTTDIPSGQSDIKISVTNNYTVERIKIYPTHTYKFSAWIKATTTSGNTYPSLFPYDVDGKFIDYYKCSDSFNLNTMTTLKQQLKTGDTKIYVNDLSQWNANSGHYYNWAAIFSYTDSTGYTYPDGTYTQNLGRFGSSTNAKTNLDKTNNIITLTTAYTGPNMPVGTKLCASTEGGTYYYPLGGISLANIQDWTYKEGTFSASTARLKYAKEVMFYTYSNNRMAGIKLQDLTNESLNGTTEYDCSGFCNNGTRTGTFTWTSDTPKYQVSTKFTGTQFITADSPTSEGATLVLWAKTTSTSNAAIAVDYKSKLGFGFYSGVIIPSCNGNIKTTYATTNYTINQWNHIVVVRNSSSTLQLYINGVLQTNTTSTQDYWSGGVIDGLSIAARPNGSSPVSCQVSDVRIYATALSADDVKSLYQNNAYIDSSGNVYGVVYNEV